MIRLYTDGSCRDTNDGPIVGWAWAAIDDERPEHTQCFQMYRGVITRDDWVASRNIAGETEAVIDGLDCLYARGITDVTVYHDYFGIAKWITGEWQARIDLTKGYMEAIDYLKKHGMTIHFEHVKAHSGDHWNEYVDRMAKEAVGL